MDGYITLEEFATMFGFNTYNYYQDPDEIKSNVLGKITIHYKNKTYTAHHSCVYPKIIYNDQVYESLSMVLFEIQKKKINI